jgi:ketosteroid isomerase-like protein
MIAKRSEPQSPTEVIHDLYAAFRRGDLAEMQRLVAADIVLHVPGKSFLAGHHRGVGEVMAATARAATRLLPPTLKVVSIDEEGEGSVTALVEVAVRAADGTTSAVRLRQSFRFAEDGRVIEARLKPEDQRRFDRLLG